MKTCSKSSGIEADTGRRGKRTLQVKRHCWPPEHSRDAPLAHLNLDRFRVVLLNVGGFSASAFSVM